MPFPPPPPFAKELANRKARTNAPRPCQQFIELPNFALEPFLTLLWGLLSPSKHPIRGHDWSTCTDPSKMESGKMMKHHSTYRHCSYLNCSYPRPTSSPPEDGQGEAKNSDGRPEGHWGYKYFLSPFVFYFIFLRLKHHQLDYSLFVTVYLRHCGTSPSFQLFLSKVASPITDTPSS